MVFARTGQMDRAVDFVRRSLHCYEIAFIEVSGIFILNKKAPFWWARFFVYFICFVCVVLCCVVLCFVLYYFVRFTLFICFIQLYFFFSYFFRFT